MDGIFCRMSVSALKRFGSGAQMTSHMHSSARQQYIHPSPHQNGDLPNSVGPSACNSSTTKQGANNATRFFHNSSCATTKWRRLGHCAAPVCWCSQSPSLLPAVCDLSAIAGRRYWVLQKHNNRRVTLCAARCCVYRTKNKMCQHKPHKCTRKQWQSPSRTAWTRQSCAGFAC